MELTVWPNCDPIGICNLEADGLSSEARLSNVSTGIIEPSLKSMIELPWFPKSKDASLPSWGQVGGKDDRIPS